jgi:hypothetical protein
VAVEVSMDPWRKIARALCAFGRQCARRERGAHAAAASAVSPTWRVDPVASAWGGHRPAPGRTAGVVADWVRLLVHSGSSTHERRRDLTGGRRADAMPRSTSRVSAYWC